MGSGLPRPQPAPAPAPTELVVAQPAAQAPRPPSPANRRPANPRARVQGRLRCTGAGVRKGVKALKTSGSRRAVKGGLGAPGSVVFWSAAGSGGPQPRPRGARRVLAPALRSGPPGGACVAPNSTHSSRVHSCLRVGPVALARVPASFRPATPAPPSAEPDTLSQIWVEKTDAGRQPEPLPSMAEIGSGRAAFRKVKIAQRSGDPARGEWGWGTGSHVSGWHWS